MSALPEIELLPGASLSITGPVLLLSAGVPEPRDPAQMATAERQRHMRLNETARPDEIRRAVLELCDQAFGRQTALVFGGHPAVSPVVLGAARRVAGASGDPLVWVVQSRHFERWIRRETLELADWSRGRLVWTPAASGVDALESRKKSLVSMREAMIGAAPYRGCVAIGGMEGVTEEARIFARRHGRSPLFPLRRTGGATHEVFAEAQASRWCLGAGEATGACLAESRAWPLVIRRILDASAPRSA